MRKTAVLLAIPLCTRAAEAQGVDAWQPPTLTTVRYDEDWRTLADPDSRTGRWTERFKYVPLGRDETYLVTGLELRARTENYRANLWGEATPPDDGYWWLRALPYADLHVGRVRAFVQPIAAYSIGVEPLPSAIDTTGLGILQSFVDVRFGSAGTGDTKGISVTIRAGRELMSFGNERLIGTRYGPNVPLAFDGIQAIGSLAGASVSIMDKRPVQPGLGNFDDLTDRRKRLSGVYATFPVGKGGLDAYWLRFRNEAASFEDGKGREGRYSVGARAHYSSDGWHWDAEGVFQYGHLASSRIRAWTGSLEVGYRFTAFSIAPDTTLRINVASGDRRADNGRLGTFNAMFPRGKYFGELSPVGPYNLINAAVAQTLVLTKSVTAGVSAMGYWRYSTADGVYDIPGNLVRRANGNAARSIGQEVEAFASWQVTPELNLSGSLSVFRAGPFLRQTGEHRTIGLAAAESTFRF